MLRKPIAIETTPYSDHCKAYDTVICNDGTIWRMDDDGKDKWYRLPDIPQEVTAIPEAS